ncbi:MAG: penicillin-binding protein 2 [Aquificae bacterium]|nr:penicillin-binding protein 2 [Aquificota bacterium]
MKKDRIYIVVLVLGIVYLVLAGRLYYLQVKKGDYYREISTKNYVRLYTINPPRGKIFDRNGILLAYDIPTFSLVALPYIVHSNYEMQHILNMLKDTLNITPSQKVIEAFSKGLITKVVVAQNLTQEQIESFYNKFYLFKGFFIEVIPKRVYTSYAKYMPHVLGYVGYPSYSQLKKNPYLRPDVLIGKSGIEKMYDDYLRGSPGYRAVIVDAYGRQKEVLWEKQPKRGKDIYLTIDARLQKIAYESFKESGHPSGAVVIINPQDYQILALLSYPIYDIEKFTKGMSAKEWNQLVNNKYKPLFNKALYGLYPPGSIYKIIVGLGALEEGIVNPYETIESGAVFQIGKWKYRNWNPAGCGNINIEQALEMSCDTFFYQIGLELGVDRIVYYTHLFGLGEKLNPRIERKISRIPSPDWKMEVLNENWFHGDTINLSIGQGYLAITPFDAVKIISPIANGGKIFKPQLLKAYFDNKENRLYTTKPVLIRSLNVNSFYIKIIKKGLYRVIYGKRGTAKILRDTPVINAGKTGTAQVSRKKSKKEEKETKWELKDHAWFVDFYPYKKPKFSVAVFVEHGESGGRVAAPIVKDIIEKSVIEGILDEDI